MTYVDFLSISLTAVTILLALVALQIAVIGFIGKREVLKTARKVAKGTAEKTIKEQYR